MKYTNPKTAMELSEADAREALLEIATILDGDPHEPGEFWTSDQIEFVAKIILDLGFTIRKPGETYEWTGESR